MPRSHRRTTADPQAGAITILVALMLLVLLTIAAVGMSRNSFREVVISGTTRQAAMTRNLSDSGIEWGIYWLDPINRLNNPGGTAANLIALNTALLVDDTKSGFPWDGTKSTTVAYNTKNPPTPPADLSFSTVTGVSQGYSIALTRMGKLPMTDMSQGSGQGAFSPAKGDLSKQAPDLWALRSDAQVTAGLSFAHAKESFISTPAQ